MVAIRTSQDGLAMHFEDEAVVGFAGPRGRDPGVRSYVFVVGYQPIATIEPEEALIRSLQATDDRFAKLTRPNRTPVWIRGSAVTEIRDPLRTEKQDPPNETHAVIGYGSMHQAIRETIATAKPILVQAGVDPGIFKAPGIVNA